MIAVIVICLTVGSCVAGMTKTYEKTHTTQCVVEGNK